ncbi:MAG: hypothetical protein IK062_11755 [Selenomonadaceae bacterium]|nr:hypothetical protein [Selenomonadaceae bacterium]
MDFASIGKVGSYLKQKNLFFAANYKIKTGQRVVDSNGNLQFAKSNMFDEMTKAQKKSDSEIDSARISSIKQKLKNGRKLTSEEMSYLREKDPSTYKKAKHAEESREELKSELKKAKTKQEARQVLTQAMIKASAEASAELAAYKSGMTAGGGAVAPVGVQSGAEISGNISVAENSAENLSVENSPSLIQANEEISADGKEMTETAMEVTKLEIQSDQETAENLQQTTAENSEVQQTEENFKNDSNKKTAVEDILEKFMFTVRALEDEWLNFTKSKKYEDLPGDYSEKKTTQKILNAIYIYRNAKN